jgi:hypothetical protein
MNSVIKLVAAFVFVSVAALVSGTVPRPAYAQGVIESQIDGEFEGWEGETVVKLMNGQVWIQTEYYYHYHYAYMPDVLVYQSRSGWKMKVEGVDKAVGVEQLR